MDHSLPPTKPELFLVTYEYPYGMSETFVEPELPYLAERFSTIWILPSRSIWSRKWLQKSIATPRKLPPSCRLLQLPRRGLAFYFSALIGCIQILLRSNTGALIRFPYVNYYVFTLRELVKGALFYAAAKQVLKQFRDPILPYTYWKSPSTMALALMKEQGLLRSIVTRCHGADLYTEYLPNPCWPFDNYLARVCDVIAPISKHGVEYLVNEGFSSEKIALSRLGVKQAGTLTQASADGILRVVSCSNIIPLKRVELIAEALCNTTVPFIWTHFGDGSHKPRVDEIIEAIPSHGKAQFMGRIPNSEVLNYYRNNPVDIFVNVSTSEGVPVSIMEALSAGIPCIATDVGGSSEIVDNDCGLLLDPAVTANQLAEIFSSIPAEADKWRRKREAAISAAKELCNDANNYRKFANLLYEISSPNSINK